MQRYFVNEKCIEKPYIYITGDDAHHIGIVMRMRPGDNVYVCSNKITYLSKITSITKEEVVLEIIEELDEKKEMPYEVCICQGMVRREKMEEVIDYCCELGAAFYLPVMMERSIVKVENDKFNQKLDRLNKIAKEAAEQSHRTSCLEVLPLVSFKEMLEKSVDYDLCLYAYEKSPKDDSLKELLKNKKYKRILVVIGPEGGISESEVKLMKNKGFYPITLGPRILRTQVAPLYIMSALGYEWEL